MIIGNLNNFKTSGLTSAKLDSYLELLRGIRADIPFGRYELDGGAYYIAQECNLRERESAKFESHKRYIDIQYILEGEEDMELVDIGELTVSDEYDEGGDFMLFTGKGALVHFKPGDFAVYFPTDGHKPSVGAGKTRKIIVKIPTED